MRGWHIHELLATGERIATPMVRRSGALRPASYAEAISVMRERLALLPDPATQVGVLASARSSNEDNFLLAKLAREVLGTNQLGVSSQAGHAQTMRALESVFGAAAPIGSLADIEHARYIFVVGSDLTRLNPIVGSNIHKAARRGSRVVALSSARTQMARLATRHLQQKPGTKRLAVIGLLKAVVARRLSEPDFAERGLAGFPALERALGDLSSGTIESATGVAYARRGDGQLGRQPRGGQRQDGRRRLRDPADRRDLQSAGKLRRRPDACLAGAGSRRPPRRERLADPRTGRCRS
jgi:formate dehydrogenase major subunit